jgi:hypothetical protein
MFEQILQRFGNDGKINFESVHTKEFDFSRKPEREYYDGPDGEFIDSTRFHLLTEKKGWLEGCRQTAKMSCPNLKPLKTQGQDVATYLAGLGMKVKEVDAVVEERFIYDSRDGNPNNYKVLRKVYLMPWASTNHLKKTG